MSNPARRLRPSALLALLGLLFAGCGGDTPSSPEENGLRPGTYQMNIEMFPSINTPDNILGRHWIVFRVDAPGTTVQDFSMASSRRTPPQGSTEEGYLEIDRDNTTVTADQWTLRIRSKDGSYDVRFTMKNAGFGDYQVTSGCYIRLETGTTFQAAGCILDRV